MICKSVCILYPRMTEFCICVLYFDCLLFYLQLHSQDSFRSCCTVCLKTIHILLATNNAGNVCIQTRLDILQCVRYIIHVG